MDLKTEAAVTVIVGLTALVALAGGIFGMAVAIKTLFFKPINPGTEFVTRNELEKAVGDLDKKIDSLRIEMRVQIKELADYARETAHRMTDTMATVSNKLTALQVTNDVVLGIKTPRAPQSPITEPV